jgi:hypothetical protein
VATATRRQTRSRHSGAPSQRASGSIVGDQLGPIAQYERTALGAIALGHIAHEAVLQRRQRYFVATSPSLAQQSIFDRVVDPHALD